MGCGRPVDGPTVSIANRVVFSDPVFNHAKRWPSLWDEMMILVPYECGWRQATELMLEHGREYTESRQAQAQTGHGKLAAGFRLQETAVEPTVYVVMTDSWIELTLRYVVAAHDRRRVKAQLHEELLRHIQAAPDITVASPTVDIVGFPAIRKAED